MNVAAAIDARSIAARFDVSIIWIDPYRFRRKPPLNRRENLNALALAVKYWAVSFSLSASAASQLCNHE
jgi:hypothetical protein